MAINLKINTNSLKIEAKEKDCIIAYIKSIIPFL